MPRLILIPGLGTNRLLFEPQRHFFDQELFLPDWIAPMQTRVEGKRAVPETLRDYSRRLSERWKETVLARADIRSGFWLGGVSFGGMIALEAAVYLAEEGLPPRGVFLIASARTSDSIPVGLRLGFRFGRLIGEKGLRRLRPWMVERVSRREGLSELDARLFRRMAEGVEPALVLWGMGAMDGWTFAEASWKSLASRGVRLHQIHGDRDWAFPVRRGHADRVVPNGRHLINMTHAEVVNEYIEACMRRDAAAEP
ncbi:MAG: alpha/beta hydrolase [Phycisphaerae bacterium]|nr:alpha/beta hydrolase [Phycisphaerae bacterium]